MEGYGYPYPPPFPPMRAPEVYPDHGDGFGDYYGPPLNDDPGSRPSRSKQRTRKNRDTRRSRSISVSETVSKSRSRSRSSSQSSGRRTSRTRSRARSRSRSGGGRRDISFKEPTILDAFTVLYLTPSKHKKNTTKFLVTKKRQDRVQEFLKRDCLGSKKWLFYPRTHLTPEPEDREIPGSRDNSDQRVKVDADFFRKYKKSKKVDADAPIAKLKRWELLFYKKLGFIQAV